MVIKYISIFMLGFFSCAFLFFVFTGSDSEVPFVNGISSSNAVAPSDWVSDDDIIMFENMVILRIDNASLSSYAPTGSMKPLFDEGANGIRIVPKSGDEISVGDIVSYRFEDKLIVHRVVEKGDDSEGIYFIMKGDNNIVSDGKVRFEDIKYVTIGIIW